MSLVQYAQSELEILMGKSEDEDGNEMQKLMNDGIVKVVEAFASEGHSGFSASYAISIISRLLNYKPLTPLTGENDEWKLLEYDGTFQNNRYFSVFKNGEDNATAYDIDGRVFSDDGGHTWYCNVNSWKAVTFPYYVPDKPEYVYLDENGENEIFGDEITALYEKKRKEYEQI